MLKGWPTLGTQLTVEWHRYLGKRPCFLAAVKRSTRSWSTESGALLSSEMATSMTSPARHAGCRAVFTGSRLTPTPALARQAGLRMCGRVHSTGLLESQIHCPLPILSPDTEGRIQILSRCGRKGLGPRSLQRPVMGIHAAGLRRKLTPGDGQPPPLQGRRPGT